ncbi:MAG TPA: sialidase family protein [Tepidisphaeraceae bacterium]|nr:sialidase family protein [Tepidisphaeraceae bacterium]
MTRSLIRLLLTMLAATGPTVHLTLSPTPGNPRNSEGDFIRLNDGKILFIYTHFTGGAADHASAHLASRFSIDGGRTWSERDEPVPAQQGGQNTMSVSLLRLNSGNIALFYLVKNSRNDCRAYLQLSSDEARTWSQPHLAMAAEGYYVVNNDRVIQLANGRIVIPAAWHRPIEGKEFNYRSTALCFLSDDEGKTWRAGRGLVDPPQEGKSGLQEPLVVELKDHRLLMLCRTDLGSQYRCYSGDGGETWSRAEPSDIKSPLSPASLKRIPSTGDLLLVWNDHSKIDQSIKGKRTPLAAAFSRDDGKTWSAPKIVEPDPDGWFCYTAIDFIDNRVLLAYCAGNGRKDGLNTTRITSIPLDWLYGR